MSFLKKVIKAVKKIFQRPAKRRRPSRKKVLKALDKKQKVLKTRPQKTRSKRPKKAVGTPVKKTPARRPSRIQQTRPLELVGEVTHYFDRIKVCVIRIENGYIKKGDRILIAGSRGELTQAVNSMQIENEDVSLGKKGQLIGLKVAKAVFVKDRVYKT